MENAVAYYRTSSATNIGTDKDSEKRQREACFGYAKLAKLEIVREFYDANVKGRDSIGLRDGFAQLIEFCQEENVSVIVFENAGRFSRDQIVQEMGYRELRKMGFQLMCADAPEYFTDDTDNPSVAMIRKILGSVAQFQKDELVLKLRGARRRKQLVNKANGLVTLSGKGKVEGRKSYKEKMPKLIREAKRLSRKNPKSGKKRSYRQISKELFMLGFRNGKNKAFHPSQIIRLLKC